MVLPILHLYLLILPCLTVREGVDNGKSYTDISIRMGRQSKSRTLRTKPQGLVHGPLLSWWKGWEQHRDSMPSNCLYLLSNLLHFLPPCGSCQIQLTDPYHTESKSQLYKSFVFVSSVAPGNIYPLYLVATFSASHLPSLNFHDPLDS